MTRLPGAPPFVRGLINMRGTIVTVLDLGVRLDPIARAGARRVDRARSASASGRSGVVVDEVLDIRDRWMSNDGGAAEPAGAIVRGVASLDDDAVIVLDLDALITQVLLS